MLCIIVINTSRGINYIPADKYDQNLANKVANIIYDEDILNNIPDKFKSNEFWMLAIKSHPILLKFVNNPTEEMCLLTINRDYKTLQYVKNPTEEMCIIAIKKNVNSIKYINNITNNIIDELLIKLQNFSVNMYDFSVLYKESNIQTEKISLFLVKRCSIFINAIKNPTEEMIDIAINDGNINYINNPTREMIIKAYKLKKLYNF